MTMKLQFAHQDYQKKAVDAVVKVFDGQPLATKRRPPGSAGEAVEV